MLSKEMTDEQFESKTSEIAHPLTGIVEERSESRRPGIVRSLSYDLNALFNQSREAVTFGDIVIISGNERIRCHRCILATRSMFFRRKFESYGNRAMLFLNGGCIRFRTEPPNSAALVQAIKFMYTDDYLPR